MLLDPAIRAYLMVVVIHVTPKCSSHHSASEPAVGECTWLERMKKEDVMVRQDYLFMILLMLSLLFFTHWGGTHNMHH